MSKKPLIQDGNEVREMTAKEFAEYEQLQTELANIEIAKASKATAKAALLNKLGITDEEARMLLS